MKAPPSSGPMTDDIPNILDIKPRKIGRFRSGTEKPIMFMAPEKRAAAPAPATARPRISIVEPVAAAQRTEPTSKMTNAEMKVHLTLKYVYTLPKEGCREVVVRR